MTEPKFGITLPTMGGIETPWARKRLDEQISLVEEQSKNAHPPSPANPS